MSGRALAALLVLICVGCGKYSPPRRVLPPPPDPGAIYDAGQPIVPDDEDEPRR